MADADREKVEAPNTDPVPSGDRKLAPVGAMRAQRREKAEYKKMMVETMASNKKLSDMNHQLLSECKRLHARVQELEAKLAATSPVGFFAKLGELSPAQRLLHSGEPSALASLMASPTTPLQDFYHSTVPPTAKGVSD